jgi:hypothetical protein
VASRSNTARIFTSPSQQLKFQQVLKKYPKKCMLSPTVISCKPAESRNVKRHLEFDRKGKGIIANWWIAYNLTLNFSRREITEDEMNLMKFFLSSNTSIIQLENQYLRNCFKFSLPCAKTFTETILPSVLDKLSNIIEKKLNDGLRLNTGDRDEDRTFFRSLAMTLTKSLKELKEEWTHGTKSTLHELIDESNRQK